MAQRKPPTTASKKPGARPSTSKPPAKAVPGRPPARKPGKSIVNQRQTPWGLIITTIVLVIFAGGVVAFAVTRHHSSSNTGEGTCTSLGDTCYVQPEIAAAKAIKGLTYKQEPQHNHVPGVVKYNTSPPIGGNHSQFWANCTGTIYNHQIANENAVHMLEHGAVWITYNPKTATKADISTLKTLVDGVDHLALSPYAGLKTPVSLQSWDYQLFVPSASDPRVDAFVEALKYNLATTPEPTASCSDPSFNAAASTPGHPFEG
ncbi:MAG TPA: DUF3105 domain-containing protein [Jatrophihabitantaceae bacterium]|jgi:hypothetical protein|nr:DUF3105 domain-containing protein [Jatrophihabitantaceae bacterium]